MKAQDLLDDNKHMTEEARKKQKVEQEARRLEAAEGLRKMKQLE